MTLDQVDAFLAVIKFGNFANAASSLYLTQSALGHRISNLEKELNYELFLRARGVRRVELTDKGSQFVSIAEEMKSLWLKALGLGGLDQQRNVRLAFIFSLQDLLIPSITSELADQGYKPYIVSSNTNGAIRSIIDGDLDFAVVGNIIPMDADAYSVDVIASERMVVLSDRSSSFEPTVSVDDLDPENEVFSKWSTTCESWHQRIFGDSFEPRFSFEDISQLSGYLDQRPERWAFVPFGTALRYADKDDLKISELDVKPPTRDVMLVSRRPIMTECYNLILETICKRLEESKGFIEPA